MAKKQRQNYMEGALILMIGGMIVKVIGAFFKVPLTNLIGATGMSYFQSGYDIYTWMYIVTTAGLPIAVSRLVSENNTKHRYANSRRIANVAFGTFLVFGAILTLSISIFSKQIADFMGSPDSRYAIWVVAIALIFEVVMSSHWGYFQGFGNMKPTAITQVIVAVCKLSVGIILAYVLQVKGYSKPIVAAGAIAGTTVGTLIGAAYMFVKKLTFHPSIPANEPQSNYRDSIGQSLKNLLSISIPIAIGACVLSVTNLVDALMVKRRLLDAGFLQDKVEFLFGSYSAMSRNLFNLPTALIVPLSTSIIPFIAARYISKDTFETKKIITSAYRVTVLLSLPCGFGFIFMAKPILQLLYTDQAAIDVAAPLLASLGLAVVFVCLVQVTNAMLQATGRERVPVFTMLVGGILKVVINYTLVGNPTINIHGAPIGTNVCYAVIMILNLIILSRALGGSMRFIADAVKPLMASVISCGGAYLLYSMIGKAINSRIATALSILLAAVVYFALLVFSRGLKAEDVELLPKGEKIRNALDKRGWLK